MLRVVPKKVDKSGQKESGRRLFLVGAGVALWALPFRAHGEGDLDAGGLTFRDFAVFDNGASFTRVESTYGPNGANPAPSKVLSVDNDNGFARIRFDSIHVDIALPLGWQATEDWERGVGYSSDHSYRVIVWRVDFAFEGVRDAEHYAATKAGAITARRPGIRAQARKLSDGSFLIAYENVPPSQGDSEPRAVFDVVLTKPGDPKSGVLVTLGVPASQAERGLKLMALLKSKLAISW